MQQVDEMQTEDAEPGQGAPQEDWFMTHPFSPLRVRALRLYDSSVLAKEGGNSIDELEAGVQVLMTIMEPSYLEGRTDTAENMRRLLFAAALSVANANGKISDKEIAVFEKFFGKRAFNEDLNLERLAEDLKDRIAQVNSTATVAQRMQIVRDLATVARADKKVSDAEIKVLTEIAKDLEVPANFVHQAVSLETVSYTHLTLPTTPYV